MNTGFMIITNNPLVKEKLGKIIMWNTKNFLMRTHLKKFRR